MLSVTGTEVTPGASYEYDESICCKNAISLFHFPVLREQPCQPWTRQLWGRRL